MDSHTAVASPGCGAREGTKLHIKLFVTQNDAKQYTVNVAATELPHKVDRAVLKLG